MKKITLLITMAMLFSLSLNAWTLGKLGDFKFEKVNANVWVMHGPVMMPNKENGGFMNNPALIESENGLIIVDPGGNYNVGKEILKEVEKVSKKPVIAIFNTHKHGDHWFANKNFQEKYPDVKIYALAYMIEKVKESSADLWYGILDRL
ncbi:MAG: MBL fold metallo-hydrolase, partial [Sulfurimonas sp.]|nr:MBL fold metallo-hydrolase [Sulfurimonas sp.]